MIVLWCTAFGIASALWSWPRIRRFSELRFVHIELVWIALVLQLALFEYLAKQIPMWTSNTLHFLTYGICIAFIAANRHLQGWLLIAVGASMNLLAISANGGTMPADMAAWRRAGLREIPPDVFENSKALSSPRLAILGDIFAVPASWPLSNVFSIGDIVIVVGGTYLAHRWCVVPTERLELSLTAT
jgi:hypothetical protein